MKQVRNKAVAICRVSTPEQRLNNSLTRQEASVKRLAEELGVEIVKTWSGDASSLVGKNVDRTDLTEAESFCKANKNVAYLIVDEPDRFMRSIEEMFYWKVQLKKIDVKLVFASNAELNTDTAHSRLLLSLDGFKAEGSNEERQSKSIKGHEQALREGRYTFHPKPGYMKGFEAGIHQPDLPSFIPLKQAFIDVINGNLTPTEALIRLNSSSFRDKHAKWKMDKFREYACDPYYAGVVEMDKKVKGRNEGGLHTPMLSIKEHEVLKFIVESTYKPRGNSKQYNSDFPMNKLMSCTDCGDSVKFTGSIKNNGYNRKTTSYYYKYHCRGCNRGYHRSEVHEAIDCLLEGITYTGDQRKEFISALKSVWESKQQSNLSRVKSLNKQLDTLTATKTKLFDELVVTGESYKEDIREAIDNKKLAIKDVQDEIAKTGSFQDDLVDFVKFSLEYMNKLTKDWWSLNHEQRVQCQQLIIPGGISFGSRKKVGTTKISNLYAVMANKKVLKEDRKCLMVELAGTAPASD